MQYKIEVKGHLDTSWEAWFAPLHIQHTQSGTTALSGHLADQAALYSVLLKINRLGLTLLAVASNDV